MKKILSIIMFAILAMAAQSYACPTLQLDIAGGTYDSGTDTIIAPDNSNVFRLYAYLIADRSNTLSDTYYVSAAVIPQLRQTNPAPTLGSFSFNGDTIDVTSEMNYGTPPVESRAISQPFDSGDLSTHSIFPTYFKEFSFQFDATKQIARYDTAINTGSIPTTGSGMYYKMFEVDLSLLKPGYGIHFDLYNEAYARRSTTDIDVSQFAPYSHDAEGTYHTPPPPPPVPEPGTIALLGIGLVALGLSRRSRRS